MPRENSLNKAIEKFEEKKSCLKSIKESENISKSILGIGLAGIAYLGIRTFIGPEIDFLIKDKEITSFLQICDTIGIVNSFVCGLSGGISYGINYFERKNCEKDLKKNKSELEKMSENYKINIIPEEYECIRYKTREACNTCDSFGRNSNDKINTEECYIPKKNKIEPDREDEFPRA